MYFSCFSDGYKGELECATAAAQQQLLALAVRRGVVGGGTLAGGPGAGAVHPLAQPRHPGGQHSAHLCHQQPPLHQVHPRPGALPTQILGPLQMREMRRRRNKKTTRRFFVLFSAALSANFTGVQRPGHRAAGHTLRHRADAYEMLAVRRNDLPNPGMQFKKKKFK